jgi:Transposase DDE domain
VTLDRTAWQCRQARINLLVIGLAYKGAAIPILWTVLPKAGCTSFAERRALLDQFIALFGTESICYLCADREFHAKPWYQYLGERKVQFCLRVRSDTPMTSARGRVVKTRNLFRQQKKGIRLDLEREREVWGQRVKVSGVRLMGGDLLVVVCSPEVADPLAAYSKRWEIETLFGSLKTRGFCLEAIRVSEPERLKKMMALLALSFCWAIKAGEWVAEQRPLKYKRDGRLARSLFRTGLDSLRRVVCNLHCRMQKAVWRELIHLLSCT